MDFDRLNYRFKHLCINNELTEAQKIFALYPQLYNNILLDDAFIDTCCSGH